MKSDKTIYVTEAVVPDLEELYGMLKDVWSSKHLTNMGKWHEKLEKNLQRKLETPNFLLFNNGTTALIAAIMAMDLPEKSEVITTPFTFAATPHCISVCGMKPVFCDIKLDTMCIDPACIEKAITKNTSAILGVHVYGFPCDVEKIQKIADSFGLKVIYDAAHAFCVKINGKSIGTFGDISMYSFHAAKLFNTVEGGGLSYNNPLLTKKIKCKRNFGIINEELVNDIGINGKMNEIQSIIGLLNLADYKKEQQKRKEVKEFYDCVLGKIKGIRIPEVPKNVTNSFQYYPIIIEEDFPLSRDELYLKFKANNIFARKYFYPLCSDFECYKNLASSNRENLPIANDLKNKVLCLPFYGSLKEQDLVRISRIFP